MTSSSGAFVKPPAGLLDDRIYERYAHLPTRIGGKADAPLSVCLEYVWLSKAAVSGDPNIILSKTKVVQKEPKSLPEVSTWIFDGVATQQAPGMDSECVLVPVLMAEDPFRLSPHKLVFCELRKHDGTPVLSNTRDDFVRALKSKSSSKPWWGIEQEVVIMDSSGKSPLGWPPYGGKPPRTSVYCRTGVDVIGRKLMESLLRCCLYAGVNCSGINLECMPACIEWQVGPLEGIACADHLWLSRYILNRLAEDFGVGLSYAPKVLPDAAGSGLHTNFSTERMRAENGFSEILVAIDRLGKKHLEHMAVYGVGNEERLTGQDDAPSIETFTFGVATRAASVRVPRECERRMRGWLEDRRPAANADPYQVCAKMFRTCVIQDPSIPFEHGASSAGYLRRTGVSGQYGSNGAVTPVHGMTPFATTQAQPGQPSQPSLLQQSQVKPGGQFAQQSLNPDVRAMEKGPSGMTAAHPVAGISGSGIARGNVMDGGGDDSGLPGAVSAEDAPVGPGAEKHISGQHPTDERTTGKQAGDRAPDSVAKTSVFRSEAERQAE